MIKKEVKKMQTKNSQKTVYNSTQRSGQEQRRSVKSFDDWVATAWGFH
jgi:hypothetical protein